MASKKLSREKVRKAGKVLVHSSPGTIEYDQALEIAQQWRLAHVYPINTFQARLRHIAKNIPGSIVAQRLKRMPTIIDKLDRYPDMQLSTMQDIGGVRIIVPTITAVWDMVSQYENAPRFTHELERKRDYITTPKSDGYRGVHLVYKYNNTLARTQEAKDCKGLRVEVQIRTQEQHIWSTAVETIGMVLHEPLKTRGGNEDWEEFFALMSSAVAIVEQQNVLEQHKYLRPVDIYRALAKKAAIINAIDIMKGYNLAAKEIQDNQRKNRSYYHIIELNIDRKVVTIRAFSEKEQIEALQEYSRLEQATQGDLAKNVVLVSMSELNKLQEAYPNYFLRMEAFLRRLEAIIDSVA